MPDKILAGAEVDLGGTKYVIPPLTLGQLRNGALEKIKKNDELVSANNWLEALQVKCEIIGIAIRRNYPDLSDEILGDMIDLGNVGAAFLAVMAWSGMAAPAGEKEPTALEAGNQATTSAPSTVG